MPLYHEFATVNTIEIYFLSLPKLKSNQLDLTKLASFGGGRR